MPEDASALPIDPKRIISLVPSDTYSLVRLGAVERLVGRTSYCVEPASELTAVETVGGTKNVDLERVIALRPDLVLANREENRRPQIEALRAAGLAVLVSFPRSLRQSLAHLQELVRLLPASGRAGEALLEQARTQLAGCEARRSGLALPTFVAVWNDPWISVSGDTFIADVLRTLGAVSVFEAHSERYPRVTLEEVSRRAPELVLLPDEPHPFSQSDAAPLRALSIPAARNAAVRLCDGKDLIWYGARTFEGLGRLSALVDAARMG